MPSTTITTIIKMIELLPENQQENIAEHLREYIADLEDEIRWDNKFRNTQSELSKIAKKVRKEISEGISEGFDYEKVMKSKLYLPSGKHTEGLTKTLNIMQRKPMRWRKIHFIHHCILNVSIKKRIYGH